MIAALHFYSLLVCCSIKETVGGTAELVSVKEHLQHSQSVNVVPSENRCFTPPTTRQIMQHFPSGSYSSVAPTSQVRGQSRLQDATQSWLWIQHLVHLNAPVRQMLADTEACTCCKSHSHFLNAWLSLSIYNSI